MSDRKDYVKGSLLDIIDDIKTFETTPGAITTAGKIWNNLILVCFQLNKEINQYFLQQDMQMQKEKAEEHIKMLFLLQELNFRDDFNFQLLLMIRKQLDILDEYEKMVASRLNDTRSKLSDNQFEQEKVNLEKIAIVNEIKETNHEVNVIRLDAVNELSNKKDLKPQNIKIKTEKADIDITIRTEDIIAEVKKGLESRIASKDDFKGDVIEASVDAVVSRHIDAMPDKTIKIDSQAIKTAHGRDAMLDEIVQLVDDHVKAENKIKLADLISKAVTKRDAFAECESRLSKLEAEENELINDQNQYLNCFSAIKSYKSATSHVSIGEESPKIELLNNAIGDILKSYRKSEMDSFDKIKNDGKKKYPHYNNFFDEIKKDTKPSTPKNDLPNNPHTPTFKK